MSTIVKRRARIITGITGNMGITVAVRCRRNDRWRSLVAETCGQRLGKKRWRGGVEVAHAGVYGLWNFPGRPDIFSTQRFDAG
jgi:hypothetical protein